MVNKQILQLIKLQKLLRLPNQTECLPSAMIQVKSTSLQNVEAIRVSAEDKKDERPDALGLSPSMKEEDSKCLPQLYSFSFSSY